MLERLIKARNKKGFTLVELIVVLVIMAILAAIMVPALLGWIDKANQKSSAAEARAVYVSAQTLYTEAYGKGLAPNSVTNSDIATLAGVTASDIGTITMMTDAAPAAAASTTHNAYTIKSIVYKTQTYTFN